MVRSVLDERSGVYFVCVDEGKWTEQIIKGGSGPSACKTGRTLHRAMAKCHYRLLLTSVKSIGEQDVDDYDDDFVVFKLTLTTSYIVRGFRVIIDS